MGERVRGERRLLVETAGIALVIYAMPFELSGVALIGGWATVAMAVMIARLWVPAVTPGAGGAHVDLPRRFGLALPAIGAWVLGVAHLLTIELPASRIDEIRGGTPFVDIQTLGALILAAVAVAASVVGRDPVLRIGGRLAALTIAAYLMPFELGTAATVVGWSALALAALALSESDEVGRKSYQFATVILVALGLAQAIGSVAPPERLFVDDRYAGRPGFGHSLPAIDHPLFWSGATAALGALAVVFAVARWRFRTRPDARYLGFVAGVLTVYLLSVGVVDHFQRQLGDVELGSLQKRAQVALSILWAVLGGATLAVGIVRFGPAMRAFGLGLLVLATAKVFVYDLASLSTSYRVLSFIGLGVLLLASSYVYQRLVAQPKSRDEEGPPSDTGEPPAPMTRPRHWWHRPAHG
jgi:uncharacterized membrane protein